MGQTSTICNRNPSKYISCVSLIHVEAFFFLFVNTLYILFFKISLINIKHWYDFLNNHHLHRRWLNI